MPVFLRSETRFPVLTIGTFAPMVEHVGNSLQAFLESTGIRPEKLLGVLPYSRSSMYRHFESQDLSTAILRDYESAYEKLGIRMNLMKLLEGIAPPPTSELREPPPTFTRPVREEDPIEDVADLLRKAADRLVDMKRTSDPAPAVPGPATSGS